MMEYKGYVAQVEYDNDARLFHGEILNIRDVITFQGTTVDDIETAFRVSVDEYLAFCMERGETPDKPFSGRFVIRLSPELHKQVVLSSKKAGKSLNAWITETLQRNI